MTFQPMLIIEREIEGRFIRVGGTRSMDQTFAGLWITRPPQRFAKTGENVWSDDDVAALTKFLTAIENERVLRAPHRLLEPRGGEAWDEYVARLKHEHGAEPPEVFCLPQFIAPAERMPMCWLNCHMSAADGTETYAWMPDIEEGARRREREQQRVVAEADLARVKRYPAAVRRFQRALRRIEAQVRRVAPRLKGTLHDLQEVRRYMGTCLGRHRRAGLHEAARWFADVAGADRASASKDPMRRWRCNGRHQAHAFELVACHIGNLARAVGAPSVGDGP